MFVQKECYGYSIIQSSNRQKLIKDNRLPKCNVGIFIEHLCIKKNPRPQIAQFSKLQMLGALKSNLNGGQFDKVISKFGNFNNL